MKEGAAKFLSRRRDDAVDALDSADRALKIDPELGISPILSDGSSS